MLGKYVELCVLHAWLSLICESSFFDSIFTAAAEYRPIYFLQIGEMKNSDLILVSDWYLCLFDTEWSAFVIYTFFNLADLTTRPKDYRTCYWAAENWCQASSW